MKAKFQKGLFALLALILVVSLISACAQPPAPTEAPAATEAPAEGEAPSGEAPAAGGVPAVCDKKFEGVELTVMPVEEPYAMGFRNFEEDMKEKFGVTFKYDFTTEPEAFNKIITDFVLGSSPYDIVLFMPSHMADISDYLEPVGDWAAANNVDFGKENWLPRAWSLYTQWKGKWITMPWDIDVVFFMYNKEAFERPENQAKYKEMYGKDLKLPETWDEYAQLAEFFQGWDWAGDGREHYGVAETWTKGYYWYMWQPRFASFGGQYFDENMKALVNSEAGVAALKNMVEAKKGAAPGMANFAYADQETSFAKGDTAMTFSWPSVLKVAELGEQSAVKGKVGLALLPAGEPGGKRLASLEGGWSMGVPKASKNKDAAMCVIWYLSQPEVHDANTRNPPQGMDPGTYSAFAPGSLMCEGYPTAADLCVVNKQSIETGYPEIYLHGNGQYMDALNYEVGEALENGKDPQQAMDDVAKKWDEITEQIGVDIQKADWQMLLTGDMQYMPEP
jgi:multiple sugar transport system substrate-binding protein